MSDDTPIEITYAENLAPLAKTLSQIERPGEFYCSGSLETPMPLLDVEGIGTISFPVPATQSRRLVKNAAERAPYGRGSDTLVDESVRKVWQIPISKVSLGGKGWSPALAEILKQTTGGLGCPESSLEAEFYKMLVYEKGGFFLAHRDTEKTSGMVGTLVITLPSAHSGGDLVIRHDGRETVQTLSNRDPAVLAFAAFYTDCEHEVRPITMGYRICLIFNLVQRDAPGSKPLQTPDLRPVTHDAAEHLRRWSARTDRADKLVCLLEHRYTEAALSLNALKGRDKVLAAALTTAARESDCALHLGLVHIEEYGWAEYNGDYYSSRRSRRYRRYWDDDDDPDQAEDPDEFEIGEVTDGDRYIDHWRNVDDSEVNYGRIPLQDHEVFPSGALDNEPADEIHFSEATGNEGASFERTYLRAALVIWPDSAFDAICASAGLDAGLARLGQRVQEANGKTTGKAADAVRALARSILDEWPDWGDQAGAISRLLSHLVQFGDTALLDRTCGPLLVGNYDGSQNRFLRKWARIAGPTAFFAQMEALFQPTSEAPPAGCIELWTELAGEWKKQAKAKQPLTRLLELLLDRLEIGKHSDRTTRFRFEEEEERENKIALTPSLLVGFIAAVENGPTANLTGRAITEVWKNHSVFSTENLILPALEICSEKPKLSSESFTALWQYCAGYFLNRASEPPKAPADWTQPLTPEQAAGLHAELKTFALDPQKRELRIRVRADKRQGFHRMIEERQLDMTHVTERRGRPYTLVCTKTLDHYHRACRQYADDFRDMKRLLTLNPSRSDAVSDLTRRLNAAIDKGAQWKPAVLTGQSLP